MIPQATLNQVQLAVRGADTYPARGLTVSAQGSSLMLRGTVTGLPDIDAAKKAIKTVLPLVDIITDQVTIRAN